MGLINEKLVKYVAPDAAELLIEIMEESLSINVHGYSLNDRETTVFLGHEGFETRIHRGFGICIWSGTLDFEDIRATGPTMEEAIRDAYMLFKLNLLEV